MPVAVPIAIVAGAAISGIASGMSAAKQSDAARQGADQQSQAARDANDLQARMYDQTRTDLMPYSQAGQGAVGRLSDLAANPFNFQFSQDDPSYQFRFNQGLDALNASAAAKGGYFSGGTGKALMDYGQGMASTEYGNAFNRALSTRQNNFGELYNLSSLGQNAAAQTGSAAQNYAISAGNNMMSSALAQGNALNTGAQAWGGAAQNISNQINSGIGNYMQYQMMNNALNRNNYNYSYDVPNYYQQNNSLINSMQSPSLSYGY